MFRILHRVYLIACVALVLGGAVWLFQKSGLSDPLQDWLAVLQNRSDVVVRPSGEISGEVIKVIDGVSFTLRAEDRQLYNVALFSLTPPAYVPGTKEGELARESQAHLSTLILSNRVDVSLTWSDPQRRAVGIVRLGNTNVNAAMIKSGLVDFNPKLIKGLPLLDQYSFLRAARIHREQLLSSVD